MKELKKLEGAKKLSKTDQRLIKGGLKQCDDVHYFCPVGYMCVNGVCRPEMLP